MSSRQPTYLFFASPKKSRQKKGDPTEAGPKSNTVVCFANFPCPTSLRIGREQRDAPRVWCSSPPSDELSSAGLCGARFSAHQQLTSGGCLNAVSKANKVSSARPAKSEQRKVALAQRGPSRQGSLLCPLSCRHKKGGRLPGRKPGAASPENKTRMRMQARNARGFNTSARPAVAGPPFAPPTPHFATNHDLPSHPSSAPPRASLA